MEAARLFVTVGANTRSAEAGLKTFNDRLKNVARGMTSTGTMMTAGLTAPLMAVAGAIAHVGISYESAFAGVMKTVDGTAEEMAVLNDGIREMARNMPATAVEIAAVAEAAGALGVPKENILDFTRVIIDLGETTNLAAEQAASDLARFANITGMAFEDFDKLGSAIVALGNAGASTESEIVDMAMRIAAAGTTIGMSEAQILGWASALSSVGIQAEAGGTAISTVMIDMAQSVATGNAGLEKFAEVAGMTTATFSELFKADSSAALQAFIGGLGELQAAGGNVFQTLEDLGFADVRVRDTLLRLASANDVVTSSLETSNAAWAASTALSAEAAIRYQTTESQLKIMRNRMSDLAITINDSMKSASGPLVAGFNEFLLSLDRTMLSLAETNPQIIQLGVVLAGVVAAAGPAIVILGTLVGAIGAVGAPVALLVTAIAGLAVAWATDFGGIQSITATVAGQVTQAFSQMMTGAQQLAAGISAAFSNTSFPSLETLWMQFKASDFQAIASTIRDTAFELMVNLDAELNITAKANELKARLLEIVNGIGLAVSQMTLPSVDWGDISIDMSGAMSRMAESINKQDWTSVGQNIVRGIGGAIGGALSLDVTWAENFANGLAAQVHGAIADFEWGTFDAAFVDLAEAVRQAIYDVFSGIGTELGPIATEINASFSTAMEQLRTDIGTTITTTVSGWNVSFSTALENLGAQIREAIGSAFSNLMPDWLTPGARPEEGESGGGPSGGLGSPKKYKIRPEADTQVAPEPLDWAKYVKPLDWLAYVKPFNWQQVTQPLAWQQFIQRMEWQTFVQPITWSQFVQMLNWSGYVARLSWNSFVSALGWNSYVGDLDWGSFVDKLDWGRFIDSVKVGSNAAGTSNWRGGLTWVGEEGAEIVDLPRGSRIYSNEESMAMTSGMTVNISVASLNNDIDIASLAMKVAREIARRTR
jgi:TP901 family phage tail tape measure protein